MFKFWLIAVAVVSGTLLIFYTLTVAQGEELPKFSTVGEAVGWVKAKGKCDGTEKVRRCEKKVDLQKEKGSSSGEWDVWAWLSTSEHVYRFSVNIVRSRYSYLSTDKAVRVRTVKTSHYFFGKNGKLTETQVGFRIENFKGENILDFQVPTESHMHGEGGSDSIILKYQLGIAWQY